MTAIIFYCLLSPAVTNMPKDKTPSEAAGAIVQGKRSSRLAEKEQAGSNSQPSSPAKLTSRVTQVRSPAKLTSNSQPSSPAKLTSQQSSPAKKPAETPSDDVVVIPTADNMSANENVPPHLKSSSTPKGLFF